MLSALSNILNKVVLKRAVIFFVFAISITLIAAIITYVINPDIRGVMEEVGDSSPDLVKEATGLNKVWGYIVNNGFAVPLQMFILTFIPIQFLYCINIMMTVTLPGVLYGIVLQGDFSNKLGLIISSIPHYVLEVFALCLLAAILFELNQIIRIKIKNLFKKDKYKISFFKKLRRQERSIFF